MMSFLAPAFLAAAAAVALPIVLHLLHRHPERRVRFAPVHLLKTAPIEQSSRRRLRDLLLLLLRVAALLLIAFAFARPFLPHVAAGADEPMTVVAVDTSFSLTAPGAFARAQALARDAVRQARSGELVALEQFSDEATVAVDPTRDHQEVTSAIDRLKPGYGATSYANALARAAGIVGQHRGTIVLVTDLQSAGWPDGAAQAAIPSGVTVRVADVGAPKGNLAVLDLRRQPGGLVATIQNDGARAAQGQARLTVNGRSAGTQPFSVPPAQTADVAFNTSLPDTGAAQVSIDDPDGYAADNVRFLALDPTVAVPVLIVGRSAAGARDGFYVEQALAAGAGTAGPARFVPTLVKASALPDPTSPQWKSVRVVVLLSTESLDRKGREALTAFVRGGGGLLVAIGPTTDPDVLHDLLDNGPAFDATIPKADSAAVALVASNTRHPVLASFGPAVTSLAAARFTRVARVSLPSGADVVAQFSSGAPALVEYPDTGGRVLLFASDLDGHWNDLPLHPSFLPLVDEMVQYLAGPDRQASAYLIGAEPAGVPAVPGVVLRSPASGAPPIRVAVNVDPRESDPARMSEADLQAAIVHLKDEGVAQAHATVAADESRQALWWYVLLVALAALVGESLIARRVV